MGFFSGSVLLAAVLASVHPATIQQLKETLAAAHAAGRSDARIAEEVSSLDMSERITEEQFAEISRSEKPATVEALRLLADASSFQDPPPSDIPNEPAPTLAGLQVLLTKAFAYARGYVRSLPDFRCTRRTARFDDDPAGRAAASVAALGDADTTMWRLQASGKGPGRFTERDVVTSEVTFVQGRDVQENRRESASHAEVPAELYYLQGLRTSGEFGGMMNSLFSENSAAQFHWRHWERIGGDKLAVLTFEVDLAHSNFFIDWCCLNKAVRRERVAYQGQVFLDPNSGVVRRVWWKAADIPAAIPTRSSETLVEYGPVAIGGKSWVCPVKSITLTETRSPLQPKGGSGQIRSLNEVVFSNYRKFDVKSRLLPGDGSLR